MPAQLLFTCRPALVQRRTDSSEGAMMLFAKKSRQGRAADAEAGFAAEM
jgi:hypothetical protein